MPSLWIVHRSPRLRAALELLAGQADEMVSGAPGDAQFATAPAPDVVILGLDAPGLEPGSWELELAFASQVRARATRALWLLTGPAEAERLALELFDNLPVEFLPYPPDPDRLRKTVSRQAAAPALAPLSERVARDALAARFARWYGDLDLPGLLRALDPTLARVPVLIQGEPGTGRGLVVRYLHTFGLEGGALLHVPCHERLSVAEIEDDLRRADPRPNGLRLGATLWLQDAERLSETTQHRLLAWIRGTALPRGIRAPFVRIVATCAPEGAGTPLHPALRRALSTLQIELPPLRERSARIGAIASETLSDWCHARRVRPRQLGQDSLAVLEQYAWPGNLHELESVVLESALLATGDPITSAELRHGGRPLKPLGGVAHAPVEEARVREVVPIATPVDTTPEPLPEPEPVTPPVEPAPPEPVAVEPAPASPTSLPPIGRMAAALSQEIQTPLANLRALAALPAERFQDAEFRQRFADALDRDANSLLQLVDRIEKLGKLPKPSREPVDVVALVEELLVPHEESIRARRLLVLKELDASRPMAQADPVQLRLALATLVNKAFELVPERGDLYIASRHHTARAGTASIRILIRFHSPDRRAALPPIDRSLEVLLVEGVIQSMGGQITVTATEGEEALVLLDLPASEVNSQ